MGKVLMMESPHIPGVYAVETDVDYTYCDKCGSFSIEAKQHLQSKAKSVIANVGFWIFVISIVWFFVSLILKPSLTFWSLIGIIGVIAVLFGTPKTFLKCRKCGNEHITDSNVLHYQARDDSVVDAPDNEIIKHYYGSSVY
jgi:hypothetical protein